MLSRLMYVSSESQLNIARRSEHVKSSQETPTVIDRIDWLRTSSKRTGIEFDLVLHARLRWYLGTVSLLSRCVREAWCNCAWSVVFGGGRPHCASVEAASAIHYLV